MNNLAVAWNKWKKRRLEWTGGSLAIVTKKCSNAINSMMLRMRIYESMVGVIVKDHVEVALLLSLAWKTFIRVKMTWVFKSHEVKELALDQVRDGFGERRISTR